MSSCPRPGQGPARSRSFCTFVPGGGGGPTIAGPSLSLVESGRESPSAVRRATPHHAEAPRQGTQCPQAATASPVPSGPHRGPAHRTPSWLQAATYNSPVCAQAEGPEK
ncbi:hypothetical protein NDU88_004352 [Pleurodeles waltl]|uniref:Uncharacterized protein n=1 Tax=Pleurodeles waltl TaxID=8319 RepID=A0AAV7NP31_PLEWA|nr:hypothetical protein NDU88_004352 [Pleurodeles waltl]